MRGGEPGSGALRNACGQPFEEQSAERFRKTVTILFSDVVDSTGLGERLDPETLDHVLTDYFEGVRPVVERHGGTLAEFIGDAVMAVFGLTNSEDDALRAVRVAVEMRETLVRLNEDFEQRTASCWRRAPGSTPAPLPGVGSSQAHNPSPATLPTRRPVSSRPPSPERSCSRSRRTGSFASSWRPSVSTRWNSRAAGLGPRHTGSSASSRWSGFGPRLEAPLVGRQDVLAQLEWVLDRAVAERTAGSCPSSAHPDRQVEARPRVRRRSRRTGDGAARALPYSDGITFWPLAEMVKQAAAISESDGPEEAVAKLEALLAPADDARTTAEAALTGLMETRGVVGEGSGACEGCSRAWRKSGRSLPFWTTPSGPSNASLADRERGTHAEALPIVLLCASRQTSSSGAGLGGGRRRRPKHDGEAQARSTTRPATV